MNSILKVKNLKTYFFTDKRELKAVENVRASGNRGRA